MAKLTYDQILLTDGRPPIGPSKRDPYKAYAEFTTTEPIEIFDIEELQKLLHGISDEIDVILVFKPGTDKFPQYQVWIAAPLPVMKELQQKCVEARNFVKRMDMLHFAARCSGLMEFSMQYTVTTSKMAYDELTKRIGIVDSVVTPYTFFTTSENVKKIISVMFVTGHEIHSACDAETKEDKNRFGYVLNNSEDDKIYFSLLEEDNWEVKIYSSVAYCHFIKVVDIAWDRDIVSICIKSHAAPDDSYSRCIALRQYIEESMKKSYYRKTPISTTMITQLQQRKVKKLLNRETSCTYFNDENVCIDKVKAFIDYIIIEAYSDGVDVKIDFAFTMKKYEITIEFTENIRTKFIPSDDGKWTVEIFSPEMIALYSIAINKTISELFPQRCNQDAKITSAIPQKEMNPRPIANFDGDLIDFIADNYDVDIVTYAHANAAKVQMLIEKINNLIKNGFHIHERTERIYGCWGSTGSENISRIYTIGNSKPEAEEIKIIGPADLDLNQNQTYNIIINQRNCIFSDLAHQVLGEPDKE